MISAKWVLAWKTDEHGRVTKAKARLVARGFSQREGNDYFETLAPSPAAPCIRLLAATACELELDLCHFDAEQALFSRISKRMFSALASGLRYMSGKVVRLNRSLYMTSNKHRARGTVICSPA